MAYSPIHSIVGPQPFNELMTPDTAQRFGGGMAMDAVDPYFGYGRFVYLKAGQAENPGGLVSIGDQTFVTATLASTAGLGFPVLVARQVMAQNSWGWYQFEGVCPIQASASVAAGVVVGIGTAGKAGANSAGKQLLGMKVLQPSTFALPKQGSTVNGSPIVQLSNVDGLFVGLAASGTGVAASTITAIDASQRQVTLSANCTANGTATITFTYTGFILVHLNTPVTQGAIT